MDQKYPDSVRTYWYCEEHDDACFVTHDPTSDGIYVEPEGDVCYEDRYSRHSRPCVYTMIGMRTYLKTELLEDSTQNFRFEARSGGFERSYLERVEQITLN